MGNWFGSGARAKYKAVRQNHAGHSFASKGEAGCFDYLTLLEKAGEIKDLECQQSVYLTDARIHYIADFKYFDAKENATIWADFKGFETPVWKIKKKLWLYYGPGILRVFKGYGTRMTIVEDIRPK